MSRNLTITARLFHTAGPLTQGTLLYATVSRITADPNEFTSDKDKRTSSHSALCLKTRNIVSINNSVPLVKLLMNRFPETAIDSISCACMFVCAHFFGGQILEITII